MIDKTHYHSLIGKTRGSNYYKNTYFQSHLIMYTETRTNTSRE